MAEELGLRAVWEDFEVELCHDKQIDHSFYAPDGRYIVSNYNDYACPHVKDNCLPAVVLAYNEGGYNSVGICADCLLEALTAWKANGWQGPERSNDD